MPLPLLPKLARFKLAPALLAAASMHLIPAAQAQSVTLTGILGEKALLIIGGGSPSLVAVGSSKDGVKLLSLDKAAQQATVEAAGQRSTLRIGDLPVSVGSGLATGGGRFITIPAGQGGHFYTDGFINGRHTNFMVDTGASFVVIGRAEAERLSIKYKKTDNSMQIRTANGVANAHSIRLKTLRIGEVELLEVDAIVGPDIPFVLLGNSFLSRFKMERDNDLMRLERTR